MVENSEAVKRLLELKEYLASQTSCESFDYFAAAIDQGISKLKEKKRAQWHAEPAGKGKR